MPALAGLWCVAALFAVGILGLVFGRSRAATTLVYAASLAITLAALALALAFLIGDGRPSSLTLPLGLPWIGAHFRVDALAAFFLIVVNLGGAIAAFMRSVTDNTRARRCAYCRITRCFSVP